MASQQRPFAKSQNDTLTNSGIALPLRVRERDGNSANSPNQWKHLASNKPSNEAPLLQEKEAPPKWEVCHYLCERRTKRPLARKTTFCGEEDNVLREHNQGEGDNFGSEQPIWGNAWARVFCLGKVLGSKNEIGGTET